MDNRRTMSLRLAAGAGGGGGGSVALCHNFPSTTFLQESTQRMPSRESRTSVFIIGGTGFMYGATITSSVHSLRA